MKPLHILEDRNIAALRIHHLEEDAQSRTIHQRRLGQLITRKRVRRLAAQVNHPPRKLQRKLTQIIAAHGPLAAQQRYALHQFNPVTRRGT